MPEINENITNKGKKPILEPSEWEQARKFRNLRDEQTQRAPTREEVIEYIYENFGVRLTTRTIQRNLKLLDLKFDISRSKMIRKLTPDYYTEEQVDRLISLVKYNQSRLNENAVKFLREKIDFEISEQNKEFEDRFPYDPVQQAWIDLYIGLKVIGEWLGIENECNELRSLIQKHRPFYWKNPKDFGYDITTEDYIKKSPLEKFMVIFDGLKASIKMAADKEYMDTLNRRNQYLKESKSVTTKIIQRLREQAYKDTIYTPVSLLQPNTLSVWIEELIGRLPEPTRPNKELLTLRNEVEGKRMKKVNPEDYILWNVFIKIFETNEREV